MVWGQSEIAWDYVGLAAPYLRTSHYEVLARYPMPGIYNAYVMYRISNNDDIARLLSLHFLRLLMCTRQFEASDDRDRIYALPGLHSTNHNLNKELFIEPDYGMPVHTIYREASKTIIAQKGNLSVLSNVQHGEDYDFVDGEESWVPMWNKVFTHTLRCGDQDGCHDAAGGIAMKLLKNHRPSHLCLSGVQEDQVFRYFPVMSQCQLEIQRDTFSTDNSQFFYELIHACSDHSLICSTLSAGKDWYGLHV